MTRFISSIIGRLIVANVAVYVVFAVCYAIWGEQIAPFFGVEWPPVYVWTVVSYMFTHTGVLNLLFNCLWLWFFGRLFLEVSAPRYLLSAYLFGGFSGAVFYLVGAAMGLGGGPLFGASAAVIGIAAYAAAVAPRIRFNLMFFGTIEMRWIALTAIVLSLLTFASGNYGGMLAHAGGALGGYGLGHWQKRHRFRMIRPVETKGLDYLLDKVKRSGYSSLTKSEKKQLSDYSNKL